MGIVADCLRSGGSERGDLPAIIGEGNTPLSLDNLRDLVHRRVTDFRGHGIRSDSCAAVLSVPGAGTACVTLTLMEASRCLPINPDLTVSECVSLLAAAQATHVVVPAGQGRALREAAASEGLPLVQVLPHHRSSGRFSVEEPARDADRCSGADYTGDEQVCLVLATSGSTAEPKLVPLTHKNLGASVDSLVQSLELSVSDRCLHSMPLFHIGAIVDLLLAPLSAGGSVMFAPRTSGEGLWRELKTGRVTWFQGVPTVLGEVLLAAKRDRIPTPLGLRFLRSVSSKLPRSLCQDLETTFGVPVIEIYGMTETAGVITSNPLPPQVRKEGSVGLAVGAEVRVLEGDFRECAPHEEGEIEVRGASVMRGYKGGALASLDEGWFQTGDRGYLDRDGYLFLTGRSKEIINRGGEKISPLEVDEVAAQFLGSAAVASFPLAHPTLGEEVALAVTRAPGAVIDEGALRRHLSERLAAHKVPRKVFYLTALPKTASGKVKRNALSALALEEDRADRPTPTAIPHSGSTLAMIQLWEEVLDQSDIGPTDDFFDRGGDSLKVAGLVARLKEEFQVEVAGFAVMDHPTPLGLVHFIETSDASAHLVPWAQTDLNRELYCDVYNVMSSWFGEAPHPTSLLRGLNTLGTKPPFFWCGQEAEEQLYLAAHLGADQPVYGMRSLHLMSGRSDAALEALAHHYASEIVELQPEGPYFVGGACLGGKVAFHIAERLLSQGREVKHLFLHEHIEPAPYAGDVCVSYTKASRYTPVHQFIDAPRGWLRYYTGTIDTVDLGCRHGKYFVTPQFKLLAKRITEHLAGVEVPPAELPRPYRGPPHAASDCCAEIRFRAPPVVMSEKEFSVQVIVTNTSTKTFEPTEESGLFLASRWVLKSGEHKVFLDGRCLLERPVEAGETVRFNLRCLPPSRLGMIYLEVDLVDDGIRWFHKRTETPIKRQAVRVVPSPAQMLSKLARS